MPAEPTTENPAPIQTDPQATGKRFPVKILVGILVVLLIEAVTVVVVFKISHPSPASAQVVDAKAAEEARIVETLLIGGDEGQFPNYRGGKRLYFTEIYVKVRNGDKTKADEIIKSAKAQITQELRGLFLASEPQQLDEPNQEVLIRQIKASLDKILMDKGETLVQGVVIPKCTRYDLQ